MTPGWLALLAAAVITCGLFLTVAGVLASRRRARVLYTGWGWALNMTGATLVVAALATAA